MKITALLLSATLLFCMFRSAPADSTPPNTDPVAARRLSSWGTGAGSIIVDDIPDSGKDLGSGVEFWPAESVFLVLNNNAPDLRRVTAAGALTGPAIALTNFWDPEEIRLIDAATNTFAISQEFHGGVTANEIVVIVIPPNATAVNRDDAIRVLRPVLTQGGETEAGEDSNAGYEAMAYKDGQFYFCLEKQAKAGGSTPSFWNVWSVPNSGGGGTTPATPTATLRFPLIPILAGRGTDVASMCFTPWGTLVLACDEGTGTLPGGTTRQAGRLVEVTLKGQLVDDTTPPVLNNGRHMRQLEGICFRLSTPSTPLQFILTGEPDGTLGTDWMVLQ
jgi:hypothetical protein